MIAIFLWIGTNPGEQEGSPTIFKLGIYGAVLAFIALVCGFVAARHKTALSQVPAFRALMVPRLGGWILL